MERAHIGPSIRIKGELFAQEPITIAGTVVGTIDVSGHLLTLTDASTIEADVVAHTIHVAGTVRGTLTADGRIVLEKTSTVEGDLSAPAVTVHDGATVQGRLDVAGHRPSLALAS